MSRVPADLLNTLAIKETSTKVRGIDVTRDARINKVREIWYSNFKIHPDFQGMAFNMRERQALGLHGLLPPAFMTQDQQAFRIVENLKKQPDDLARYVQLNELQVSGID